jgi:fumarate reductase flavoprotein subunit
VLRSLAKYLAFVVLIASIAAGQNGKDFTADKHKALGLGCADCHGTAEKASIDQDACLKCHESMQSVAKRTAGLKPNPHENHMSGQTECLQCHHGHKSNEISCLGCHAMEFKRAK